MNCISCLVDIVEFTWTSVNRNMAAITAAAAAATVTTAVSAAAAA